MKTQIKLSNLTLLTAFLLFAWGLNPLTAQVEIELIEEESSIWIEGSSTVHDINCKAGALIGFATVYQPQIDTSELNGNGQANNDGRVDIKIPVMDFDCGRRQMNRDFYRALRAKDFPSIEFEYFDARLKTNLEPECHPFQLEVEGALTVAGVKKEVVVMVDIEPCEEDKFILKGSKKINMKDFDIEPPSALFGLIRAHEELEVFFSLTARQKSGTSITIH